MIFEVFFHLFAKNISFRLGPIMGTFVKVGLIDGET